MLLLCCLLPLRCLGAGLAEEYGADRLTETLPADAAEALDGLDPLAPSPEAGLNGILALLRDRLGSVLAEILRPAASILAVVLLCSVLDRFSTPGGFDAVQLGGCLAVSALAVSDLRSAVQLGSGTLEQLCDYSKALLPTLTAAAVGAGALTSAGAKYAASALFSDLLMTAARDLILPLICAAAALAAAGAALGTKQLQGAEKLLTWLGKSLMKYLVLAFTVWLSLTGVLSGSADAAAVKAARTAISAGLPVVGRTLSDASEALVSAIVTVRNAAGILGILAVAAAVALPLLRLGLCCLLYRAAAALGGMVAGERMGRLLNSLGTVYGMLMGLVGAGSALLLLSIVSLIRTVTG